MKQILVFGIFVIVGECIGSVENRAIAFGRFCASAVTFDQNPLFGCDGVQWKSGKISPSNFDKQTAYLTSHFLRHFYLPANWCRLAV